ncbi:MAG: tetratricopeptide repeat protein [Candidatus Acidiferrales bacterium]
MVKTDTVWGSSPSQSSQSSEAESKLQTGITLTRQGRFSEAIPYFLAARGHVTDEYAASFNLALCYLGTNQFDQAIQILDSLTKDGHETADVNDLLAQAYVGSAQPKKALAAFQQAAEQNPQNERLYLFVTDACMDHQAYDLGIEILNLGLQRLPHSARLHYERGVFFTFENQPDQAKSDFNAARELAPGSEIFYMAAGQAALLEGNIAEAIRITHQGIQNGHENYILLAIFGAAVARSGATPSQREFAEAQKALEKSAAERPDYEVSQIALGELYLAAGRLDDAIARLQNARLLAPTDTAIYSHLAIAYRRRGNLDEEKQMLTILSKLNQEQAEKYKTDSPNKAGYVASGRGIQKNPQQ